MRDPRHILPLTTVVLVAAGLLAGCGGEAKPTAAPGSPQNPVVATIAPEGGKAAQGSETTKPGFQKIVERQPKKPKSRFTPCNLVSKAQGRAILRSPIADPVEAPQGPTCIYRTQDGRSFITLAVQSARFAELKRQLSDRQSVEISSRTGYCGRHGQPVLYLPLSSGRVLTIAARCEVATQFAATALRRLNG